MTDEQLTALLRLKRFEQPPPGYFDRLLQDVHRRQREELLHRPLWKIAAERMQTFFSEHSMGSLSYAGAMASVVAAGVITIGVLTSGGGDSGTPLASNNMTVVRSEPTPAAPRQEPAFAADQFGRSVLASNPPRYVIDARPVSYDASFSF